MQISAKTEHALRALLTLASHDPELVKIDAIPSDQEMPRKFAATILSELRRAGLIHSSRGAGGGYRLTRSPGSITVGAVLRATDGPFEVRGLYPDETHYPGAAIHLPQVWLALRYSLERVLDETTLAQLVTGSLPPHVRELAAGSDWAT